MEASPHDPVERALLAFWAQKDKQQQDAKRTQGGTRDSVTGGRHLNALQDLLLGEFVAAGFPASMIFTSTAKRVLPGWFRPTKSWDLAVIHGDHIVGLVELKSQVGSLGNNANNRAEEAIGNAIDVRYACKNKLLGPTQPWLAYVFVTEDEPSIHEASSRRTNSHYPQRSLFTPREPGGISYVERLAIMGRELVREDLYQAVWIMITADPRKRQFSYRDVADEVGHRNFRLAVRKFSAGLGYKAGVNGDLILGQGDQASLFA